MYGFEEKLLIYSRSIRSRWTDFCCKQCTYIVCIAFFLRITFSGGTDMFCLHRRTSKTVYVHFIFVKVESARDHLGIFENRARHVCAVHTDKCTRMHYKYDWSHSTDESERNTNTPLRSGVDGEGGWQRRREACTAEVMQFTAAAAEGIDTRVNVNCSHHDLWRRVQDARYC